ILKTTPAICSTMKNTAPPRQSLGLAVHPSHAGTLTWRGTPAITSSMEAAGAIRTATALRRPACSAASASRRILPCPLAQRPWSPPPRSPVWGRAIGEIPSSVPTKFRAGRRQGQVRVQSKDTRALPTPAAAPAIRTRM
ncbi:T0106201 isoform 1, partial [Pan troglodytes]